MTALAITYTQQDVPREGPTITLEQSALTAALRLSYLAGQADAAHDAALSEDAFQTLRRMIRDLARSLRRARPTARQEVEAGLDSLLYTVEQALGITSEIRERDGRMYRVYA